MKHPLLSLGEDMLRGIAQELQRERATRTEEETQDLLRESNLGVPFPFSEEEAKRIHEHTKADEIFSEGRQRRTPFRINPHGE